MPNKIFQLGLTPGELVVYSFLLQCENWETYQCYPSYRTIGETVGLSRNAVKSKVDNLIEKQLIYTEPTTVKMKDGRTRNGTLLYTIRPLDAAKQYYIEQQAKENARREWLEKLRNGELRITKSATFIKGERHITEPKTKSSIRVIVLPGSLLEILRNYKASVNSRWMFPSPVKIDSPLTPNFVRRRMQQTLERAQCKKVRFHDLRHTFATDVLHFDDYQVSEHVSGIVRVTKKNFSAFAGLHKVHDDDMYWNNLRLLAAIEDWNIYMLYENGSAVGAIYFCYIDGTMMEIFGTDYADDQFNSEVFRKLLTHALNEGKNAGMQHLVFFTGEEDHPTVAQLGFNLVSKYVLYSKKI